MAIIGLGFVGGTHLDALRRRGIRVQGVLGSSPARTKDLAQSLGIDHTYESLEAVVADKSVQVVHICTPNYLHFEQAKAAIEAGKHVMCEKPLAMTTSESRQLLELARRHQRVGGVAYNLRYYPLCQEARSIMQRGLIGEPKLVHGSFLQDWLLYPTDWNWRLEQKLGGELRAISDIGTHWLDLVTWITSRKVTDVCADLATVVPRRQRPRGRLQTFQTGQTGEGDDVKIATEDYGSVLLHFENAMRGVMTVSQVSAGRKARLWFEIDGSEGSLAWNSESPNNLWIGKRNEPNKHMAKDPALMSPEARGYAAYPGGHAEGYPDTFAQLFKDFYSYVATDDLQAVRTFPTFETGHEELLLCEAIASSARERRWIPVSHA
ncbi:MAG: Gfo/Idh/MocA family oxidoreductase [Acidobacteriota bacterium]|nr:Gfo/Idh/MocA family oxidoreductase [Acidobacteriota bacterium]